MLACWFSFGCFFLIIAIILFPTREAVREKRKTHGASSGSERTGEVLRTGIYIRAEAGGGQG